MPSLISSVILNADDYGLTPATNRAIHELSALRVISSTSLMANMPFVEEASRLREYPSLGIGVHLNLTTGRPISNAHTLTNESGAFFSLRQLIRQTMRGKVNVNEVRAEIEAQVERVSALVGDQLDHWDSHEGFHRFEPFASIAISACRAHRIGGMRIHRHFIVQPTELLQTGRLGPQYGMRRMMRELYYRWIAWRGGRYFATPHGLLVKLNGTTLEVMRLLAQYGSPVGGFVWELPCHPAASLEGLTAIEQRIPRLAEHEFLKSATWSHVLQSGRVQLTTFARLREK
jgi:predicted glycoside hydrolase/deacetylase ChbG (UPF0249 family)